MSSVQKLVLSNEAAYERVEDEAFARSLLENLRMAFCPAPTPCGSAPLSRALRSLRLEDLQLEKVPESLRALVACEELNLSGWSLLHSLPAWLSDLPLRKLLVNNCYSLETDAIPSSFTSMTSLQELHLLFVGNIVGSTLGVDLSGAIGLETVKRNLGALSASRPDLRFRVLSEIKTREPGVSLCLESAYGFWSAAQGLDCVQIAIDNIALAFCDVCNASLGFGNWWHQTGAGYDLCCKHHHENRSSGSSGGSGKFVEVKSEKQIEDNREEFSEYLRNSQFLPTEAALEAHGGDEGAAGVDAQPEAGDAEPGEAGDDSSDEDEDAMQQMFLDMDEFVENGLHALHGGVWLAADEEMVEVTAPIGEGDGDHIL